MIFLLQKRKGGSSRLKRWRNKKNEKQQKRKSEKQQKDNIEPSSGNATGNAGIPDGQYY